MREKRVLSIALAVAAICIFSGPSFALDVGDKAPPFSVDSTLGKIESSDYIGTRNVVLALYFAAFTPV